MKLTTLLFAIATILGCVEANGGVTPEGERPEWEATTVKCYDYAPTVVPSIFYSVKVNGQSAMTLPTTEAHVCLFSCDGLVEVEIDNLRTAIESVVVRPISKNYTYSHDGSSVKLYLRPYDQVVVEINGDETNPLFVFVNPLEEGGRPQEDDPNAHLCDPCHRKRYAAQSAAKIAGSRQHPNHHGSVRSRNGRSYGSSCEAI